MRSYDFSQVLQRLNSPANIVITTHQNPDGDAIGSALAVYHILKQLGHKLVLIIPNQFPDFLRWMPSSDLFHIFDEDATKQCITILEKADIIICVDFNSPKRVQKMEDPLRQSGAYKILIDHHPGPEMEAFDFIFSDIASSSTAELVYDFFDMTGYNHLINKDVADCLYAGIITDTGSFSFSCSSAKTYRIVADLIERGLNPDYLHRLIYDTFTENRLRLLGHALSNRMIVLPEFHTAIIALSKADMELYRHKVGDTEGIVNFPLSIREVNLSILITEKEGFNRLSIRSKGEFEANLIAKNHFEGGGHQHAAGGNSYIPLSETVEKIREILPLYKEKLTFVIG